MRGALGVCNKDLCTCPLLLLEPGKLQTDLGFAFSGRFLKENQPPTYPGSGEAQGPGNCIQGCVLKLDVLHALHGVVLNFQWLRNVKKKDFCLDRTAQSPEKLPKREFDF